MPHGEVPKAEQPDGGGPRHDGQRRAHSFMSASRSYRTISPASWPGLSRPSTSFSLKAYKKDVDARVKRGHDGGEVIRSHRNALVRMRWRRRHDACSRGDYSAIRPAARWIRRV